MDAIKPPTDNLYKFAAITGLLMIAVPLYWLDNMETLYIKEANANLDEASARYIELYLLSFNGIDPQSIISDFEANPFHDVSKPLYQRLTPCELEKRNEKVAEFYSKATALSSFPASDSKETKAWWVENTGISPEAFDACVNQIDQDNVVTRIVRSARKLLTTTPSIDTLLTRNDDIVEHAIKRRNTTFVISGLGCACFAVGSLLWYRRVQRHEDRRLSKPSAARPSIFVARRPLR